MADPVSDIQPLFDAGRSPADLGFRMPAEFEPHVATWMAWPHDDHPDIWGDAIGQVQKDFAAVAEAIAVFEPVRVVVHPEQGAHARAALSDAIDTVLLPQGDLWFRDTGPLFLNDKKGRTAATNLVFNAWGNKFPGMDDDVKVGEALCRHLQMPYYSSILRAEGGGICVDGEGTAVTTETFLLNANRNPGLSRGDIEDELKRALGVSKVIWLPGDEGEWITDGHIDGMMMFSAPGKALFEINPDPANPRARVCRENLLALQGQTDARGREIEIGLVEEAYLVEPVSEQMALSYVNALIVNGGVVMPAFDTPTDSAARDLFAQAFPDRKIVQIPILNICPGGGGIHCITQQQPAGA